MIKAGQFQVESGLQREYRRDGEVRTVTGFIPSLLRLGLTEQLELRIESNFATSERVTSP